MKTSIPTLVLAAALAISAVSASAATLGEQLDSGAISYPAFQQLIAGAGVSEEEARQMTVSDIAVIKWQDD